MIDKIIIKPLYVLLFLLFASLVYLSILINEPDGINFYIIHLMIIILNIIVMRIFYLKILKSNSSNIKLLSFKYYTFNNLVYHIIYLVIIIFLFTPVPFLNFLLYYLLLVVFLVLSFSMEFLQVTETNDY